MTDERERENVLDGRRHGVSKSVDIVAHPVRKKKHLNLASIPKNEKLSIVGYTVVCSLTEHLEEHLVNLPFLPPRFQYDLQVVLENLFS